MKGLMLVALLVVACAVTEVAPGVDRGDDA